MGTRSVPRGEDAGSLMFRRRTMRDRVLPAAFTLATGIVSAGVFTVLLVFAVQAGMGPFDLLLGVGILLGMALAVSASIWMVSGMFQLARLVHVLLGISLVILVALIVMTFMGRPFGFMPFLGALWIWWLRSRFAKWMRVRLAKEEAGAERALGA